MYISFIMIIVFLDREEIRKLTNELNVARETQRKASTSEESAGKTISVQQLTVNVVWGVRALIRVLCEWCF